MSGIFENPAFLLLGVVVLAWFAIRFFGRGTSGLSNMFRKEKAGERRGMGRKAIAGLLADVERLVADTPELKGALLVGVFAAGLANPRSKVDIILLAGNANQFDGAESLAGWAYPRRGHDILAHEVRRAEGCISHQFRLRGAPEVAMHLVNADSDALPRALATLLAEGALVIAAGMGTSAAHERWKKAKG